MKRPYTRIFCLFFLLCGTSCVKGPSSKNPQLSTGTGFIVNSQGYILTNQHVIDGCNTYTISNSNFNTQATLISKEEKRDLALLKITEPVKASAVFASPITPLREGEGLLIIGYPDQSWKASAPSVRKAKLMALTGPGGEDTLMQFSDSISKGNSGGPLLNNSGEVIGIVLAKAVITMKNKSSNTVQMVKRADVAIDGNLATDFLRDNDVSYTVRQGDASANEQQIASNASQYVVSVQCRID